MNSNPECYKGKTLVAINQEKLENITDFDAGMMFDVLDVVLDPHDNVWILTLDFARFVRHNQSKETPTHHDSHNKPTLKWSETNTYPSRYWLEFLLPAESNEILREATENEIKEALK